MDDIERIVVAVGDPHAKVSNTKEIDMLADSIIDVVSRLKTKNPEAHISLVILGDLANDFERIHILALRSIVNFLQKVTSLEIPVFYIIGNHDCINNQVFLEDYHAFVGMNMPYLHIVEKPISKGGFVFCPYVPPGRLLEALEPFMGYQTESDRQANNPWIKDHAAVFCHQELKGAQMGAIVSKHGDEWPEDFPLLVSGHVHDRQWLQKNALYVGEPMDSSYGNTQKRTISILLFKGVKLVGEKPYDLGLPRKVTVNLTVEEAKTYQIPEGASIRINLRGTTEELVAFRKTKEYAALLKTAKIVPKHTDKIVVKANKERTGYLDLLKKACESESESVQRAFEKLVQPEDSNAA